MKIDSNMSLLNDRPTELHVQELRLPLPVTFAQWNSYGLCIWMQRAQDEPADRELYRPLDVAQNPLAPGVPTLLVEDIRLSLCRLVPKIWEYCHEPQVPGSPHNDRCRLLSELDIWTAHLVQISQLYQVPHLQVDRPQFRLLFKSYLGEEDERTESGQRAIVARIKELVDDAMSFQCVLRSCLEVRPGGGVPKLLCSRGILSLDPSMAEQ